MTSQFNKAIGKLYQLFFMVLIFLNGYMLPNEVMNHRNGNIFMTIMFCLFFATKVMEVNDEKV